MISRIREAGLCSPLHTNRERALDPAERNEKLRSPPPAIVIDARLFDPHS